METKYRIVSIHKEDAYYQDRETLIGQEIVLSVIRFNTKKGYIGAEGQFIDQKLRNRFKGGIYFYAVKLEDFPL